MSGRVIVLGADGMDATLTAHWLRDGTLPHLARLAARGCWSPLQTTNPAESPVAWATFVTGLNPGQHGIYDFLHRDPHTYLPRIAPLTVRFAAERPGLVAINHRAGETIWSVASTVGRSCTLLRVPGTCPPEPVRGRMLSGLGVPDLLGTWGSSFLYTTEVGRRNDQQTIRLAEALELEAAIPGPRDTAIPLHLTRQGGALRLSCQGQNATLAVGEWTPWWALRFTEPTGGVWPGMARFHLQALQPHLRLYLAPLNLDPRAPLLSLTYPDSYIQELVSRWGVFSTLGWPEDATGVNEGRLDEDAFLQQVHETFDLQAAMALDALARDEDDLLIAVLEATDRVQHLFWRHQDPCDPLHTPESARRYGDAIRHIYRRFDSLVGEMMAALDPTDTLLVLSDHGFKPVYRLVHLNAWLRDQGYLVADAAASPGDTFWRGVDWRRTRAYAIGLSKVYVNLRGREREGIVAPGRDYDALCAEIAARLRVWRDPETGEMLVQRVYRRDELYRGGAMADAGDVVIGFRAGYRTSSQTAVGRIPAETISPNRKAWSADHCSVDPSLVPGVLFCSRPLDLSSPSLLDLAPTILDVLSVPVPPEMEGHSLRA